MRWQLGRRSQNVEDRRGMGTPGGMRLPGGVGLPGGLGRRGAARGGGIGVIGLLLLLALGWLLGVDPSFLLQDASSPGVPSQPAPSGTRPPADDQAAAFVSAVLADTEDTWHALFEQRGGTYREPTLVLFSGAVESACGFAQAAMGPFYCPGDQKVYIDLDLLRRAAQPVRGARRLRAGLRDRARGRASRAEPARHRGARCRRRASSRASARPTRCRCGWSCRPTASPACGAITPTRAATCSSAGDIEEGLNAAAAIGDDRLQRQTHRLRRARRLHPRQLGAARALVPARAGERRPARPATRSTPGGRSGPGCPGPQRSGDHRLQLGDHRIGGGLDHRADARHVVDLGDQGLERRATRH